MKLNELRAANDGTLPSYAWPGGYQMVYHTRDGLTICPDCANKEDTSDPVASGEIYYEGDTVQCEDCGKDIESAYGNLNDPDDVLSEEAD